MSFGNFLSKIRHNYIWNNKFVLLSIIFGFLVNLSFFIYILVNSLMAPRESINVLLHYTIYHGIDSFGSPFGFLIYPVMTSLIFLINSLLCYHYYRYNRLLAYFLIFTFIAATIFMVLSYILTILFIKL